MRILLIIGIIIASFLSGVYGTISFNAFENKNKKEQEHAFSTMLGFLTITIIIAMHLYTVTLTNYY